MVTVRSVGALEAKTKLGAFLTAVEQQRAEFIITKHARPVARLVPFRQSNSRAEALRRLDAIPVRKKNDTHSTKDLIAEGRR